MFPGRREHDIMLGRTVPCLALLCLPAPALVSCVALCCVALCCIVLCSWVSDFLVYDYFELQVCGNFFIYLCVKLVMFLFNYFFVCLPNLVDFF